MSSAASGATLLELIAQHVLCPQASSGILISRQVYNPRLKVNDPSFAFIIAGNFLESGVRIGVLEAGVKNGVESIAISVLAEVIE